MLQQCLNYIKLSLDTFIWKNVFQIPWFNIRVMELRMGGKEKTPGHRKLVLSPRLYFYLYISPHSQHSRHTKISIGAILLPSLCPQCVCHFMLFATPLPRYLLFILGASAFLDLSSPKLSDSPNATTAPGTFPSEVLTHSGL